MPEACRHKPPLSYDLRMGSSRHSISVKVLSVLGVGEGLGNETVSSGRKFNMVRIEEVNEVCLTHLKFFEI